MSSLALSTMLPVDASFPDPSSLLFLSFDDVSERFWSLFWFQPGVEPARLTSPLPCWNLSVGLVEIAGFVTEIGKVFGLELLLEREDWLADAVPWLDFVGVSWIFLKSSVFLEKTGGDSGTDRICDAFSTGLTDMGGLTLAEYKRLPLDSVVLTAVNAGRCMSLFLASIIGTVGSEEKEVLVIDAVVLDDGVMPVF